MAHNRISIKKEKSWHLLKDTDWRESEGISPWLGDEEIKGLKSGKFFTTIGYLDKTVHSEIDSKIPLLLEKVIKESQKLLQLEDNWDEEGSSGYSEITLNKAVKFLKDNAINYFKNSGVWVTAPEICPGPDGSIDLLWKLEDRELLINIPVDENQSATYYGDDSKNNNVTKGKLNLTEKHEWILMWLMK